jgi:hypothetical protein
MQVRQLQAEMVACMRVLCVGGGGMPGRALPVSIKVICLGQVWYACCLDHMHPQQHRLDVWAQCHMPPPSPTPPTHHPLTPHPPPSRNPPPHTQVLCTSLQLMTTQWWWVCCLAHMPTLTTSLMMPWTSSTAAHTKCTTTATGVLTAWDTAHENWSVGTTLQMPLGQSLSQQRHQEGGVPSVDSSDSDHTPVVLLELMPTCQPCHTQVGCAPEWPPAHLDTLRWG